MSDEDLFQKAEIVAVGRVLVTRYVADEATFGGGYIDATVIVSEPLKGQPAVA